MRSSQIKILVVCLFSLMITSTAFGRIGIQGERDNYPDRTGEGREIVLMAVNVGRIIGNLVFTLDDDLVINKNLNRVKSLQNKSTPFRDSRGMAIAFGIVALLFLIVNMYFGGKIVEYLKSKGRKAHYWALRWMIFSYVNQYKKITVCEDGRTGPFYWQISISAILFVVAMAIAVYFAAIA